MHKFTTELEKQLWEMLYRSQMALAVMCIDRANRNRGSENDWPAGQEWNEMVGSSHAIFCRVARAEAGIDDDAYLDILRNNEDALSIAEPICEKLASR